jgi:hypothetical protein
VAIRSFQIGELSLNDFGIGCVVMRLPGRVAVDRVGGAELLNPTKPCSAPPSSAPAATARAS